MLTTMSDDIPATTTSVRVELRAESRHLPTLPPLVTAAANRIARGV